MSEERAPAGLPGLPGVRLEVLEERLEAPEGAFLRLRRLRIRNRWDDGVESAAYRYDVLERDAVDAVTVVLWARPAEGRARGEPFVCLRSSLRPPLALRPRYRLPLPEPEPRPLLWELPAGLVEANEVGEEGLRACAARETLEETGLVVPPEAFRPLGPPFFLSPGVVAEQIHLFHAEVDPAARREPETDGHPVEARARVVFVPLAEALGGALRDVKTELGLRRFREMLG